MNTEKWTGGAVWHDGTSTFGIRRATWPFVELHLDTTGGSLHSTSRPQSSIRFRWPEIERAERVKVLGIPFWGEGIHFIMAKAPKKVGSGGFIFYTATRGRTINILGLLESKGVRVAKKARFSWGYP